MSNDTKKKISCPNCAAIAEMEGDKINCVNCDTVFTITKTGPAKVDSIGRIQSLEDRVDKHESLLQGLIPEPDPAKLEPDPAKLEPDPAEEEPSILG